MRMYETIFIVQPDLGDEDLKGLSAKVQEVIAGGKGNFKKLEDWGVRKLAYPISKFTRGRYYYLRFDADAALIAELERRFRLDDRVVRYQSVKLEKETAPSAAAPVVEVEETVAAETEESAAESE
ncbi:MAG: small subunit ribosomal protein [Geobacteraceae bacterium]|nr:MAG: small subunit ribosomal protein [Geobacteraceae bacterium]